MAQQGATLQSYNNELVKCDYFSGSFNAVNLLYNILHPAHKWRSFTAVICRVAEEVHGVGVAFGCGKGGQWPHGAKLRSSWLNYLAQ